MATPFSLLAETGLQLSRTQSRNTLRGLAAQLLRRVEQDEIDITARMIIGKVVQQHDARPLGMSANAVWRAIAPIFRKSKDELQAYLGGIEDFGHGIRRIFSEVERVEGICPEEREPLMLDDVYGALQQIASLSGSNSRPVKEIILRELLCRATPDEAMYVTKNIIGDMRHGVSEGLMIDGIAQAAGIDPALVKRSYMFIGEIGTLAKVAIIDGVSALERFEVTPFMPMRPMLANSADDVSAAWAQQGDHLALEYKLDGARVQIHKVGDEVRLYTRHLMEITASLPDIVEMVCADVTADDAVLEGEVVAVDHEGRVLPFQELMRRFRRIHDVPRLLHDVPVRLYLFDVLYQNGQPLIDHPNAERWQRLGDIVREGGAVALVPRIHPQSVEEGTEFFNDAIDQGHEGLISKKLDSPYAPGVRGNGWLKIKEALTVDLVVIAAEWGYGRQTGWLSNYHLAALDIVTGELVMVGKTFKGLTDQEFARMTEALMERRAGPHGKVVTVRPEIVVEVAFNQILRSPSYPGGVALRFARIVHFRPDKSVEDIDTLQTLRDIYIMQSGQQTWQEAA